MLEGCILLQPSQEILFHACSPVTSAGLWFQLGFQDASDMHFLLVHPDSMFLEETLCPKAPRVPRLPSSPPWCSHKPAWQEAFAGVPPCRALGTCHLCYGGAALHGHAAVATCCSSVMPPAHGKLCPATSATGVRLVSVSWVATAETAVLALFVINREKQALSGAMRLTSVRYLLLTG